MRGARVQVGALAGFVALAALAWGGRAATPDGAVAWPSLAHPLGVDVLGRDFLGVLARGGADFVGPGLLAIVALLLVVLLRAGVATARPVLEPSAPGTGPGWFLLAAPPRLLLVMLVMLLLDAPSPLLAAAVVTALYVPVALDEIGRRLRALQEEQLLAGLVAHGLSAPRIVVRHLLGGYLREPVQRHGAMLFAQVAFTQIALAWVFGASAVSTGLGVSWGMELKRYAAWLPSSTSSPCLPDLVCAPAVATLHVALLLLVCLGGLGALTRSQPG